LRCTVQTNVTNKLDGERKKRKHKKTANERKHNTDNSKTKIKTIWPYPKNGQFKEAESSSSRFDGRDKCTRKTVKNTVG